MWRFGVADMWVLPKGQATASIFFGNNSTTVFRLLTGVEFTTGRGRNAIDIIMEHTLVRNTPVDFGICTNRNFTTLTPANVTLHLRFTKETRERSNRVLRNSDWWKQSLLEGFSRIRGYLTGRVQLRDNDSWVAVSRLWREDVLPFPEDE